MMSLTALSIDAMMPALPQIGSELGVQSPNERQLVISMIFLGLAIGQLFFGPLSDNTGRKPAIYAGYGVYLSGALLAIFANNFPTMLAGRLLQGIGASAPRAITLAVVRDRYAGRRMAQVMSFVMTVFILVPMIAPSMGQAVMGVFGWRGIFVSFVFIALITMIWFAARMPETLSIEDRTPFSLQSILIATVIIIKNRTAFGYAVSAGLIGGAFLGYLSSAQQIFQEQYALGTLFPIIFGVISLAIGMASLLNARLVMSFGMRFLVTRALWSILGLSIIALVIALLTTGHPPLWFVISYLMLTFFSIGLLFGNQNALAMEPLGHLAGIGAAIVGSLSTLIQMPLGTIIGQNYNGTIFPLVIGITILTLLSIFVVYWVESQPRQENLF